MNRQALKCPGRYHEFGYFFHAKMHFFETLLSRSPSQFDEMKPIKNSIPFEHPPLHGNY